jgi:hypothetical protein
MYEPMTDKQTEGGTMGAVTCIFLVAATCMMVFFIATAVRITHRSPLATSLLPADVMLPWLPSIHASGGRSVRRWEGSCEQPDTLREHRVMLGLRREVRADPCDLLDGEAQHRCLRGDQCWLPAGATGPVTHAAVLQHVARMYAEGGDRNSNAAIKSVNCNPPARH